MRKFLAALAIAGAAVTGGPAALAAPQADPTAGLKQYSDDFSVQKPYNLATSDRFSTSAGPVYNAWIQQGDKAFKEGSPTGPRTEMRWHRTWSQIEHQFSADVLVDSGTDGACIMQVKGSTGGEAIYLNVHSNGNLYNSVIDKPIATGLWGKWFHLNADFNPANGNLRVWVNGQQVLSDHYDAPASKVWYFKNGVYNTRSAKSEAHFKNITFWTK
ncbi:polysaccharide lyase family 7 protein [Kutzneria chonburiensis]|uniref:Polysaccharide lyase family 7 protein n=1 Tax=Kutzneria chonburiensis TaxID=1483604 RepID=A0ABV6MKY4_9PSEU|nr:polysaccharide lyase family 7 protein [Kutzneria chonburiensis]